MSWKELPGSTGILAGVLTDGYLAEGKSVNPHF